MIAAENGFLEITNALIKKGANVNHTNQVGDTALILAAENGFLKIVNSLIENNANLNYANQNGNTTLMMANKNNHIIARIIEQLNQLKAENLINAKEMILNINNVLNEQLKKTNEIKDNQNDNEIWKNNQEEIIEIIDNYEHNLNQKLKNINSELNNHSLRTCLESFRK